MTLQDHADSGVNDTGTNGKIDTPLTRASSRSVLEKTRRDLIVMRNKHGADSAIGHRCSNLVELLQMPELPQAQYDLQMEDLRKLLSEEPAASRASHYS